MKAFQGPQNFKTAPEDKERIAWEKNCQTIEKANNAQKLSLYVQHLVLPLGLAVAALYLIFKN
jgi:hypothetical protein